MINKLIPVIAVLVLFVYAFPSDAQVPDRRWIVQTSDGKLIGFTDDQDVEPPDAAFATFVIESVIRLSDPPGATGDILPLGTWDAATSTYTPPSGGGLTPAPYDPTTDSGEVKDAAHQMMDVFENALAYIEDFRHVWTQDTGDRASDGIHWMMVNSARVALNSTRTHANRQKFLEEAASWPTMVNGVARQYVDAFAANDASIKYPIQGLELGGCKQYCLAALRLWVELNLTRLYGCHQRRRMPQRVRRLSEGSGSMTSPELPYIEGGTIWDGSDAILFGVLCLQVQLGGENRALALPHVPGRHPPFQ